MPDDTSDASPDPGPEQIPEHRADASLARDLVHLFASVDDAELDAALATAIERIGAWSAPFGAMRSFLVRWHRAPAMSLPAEWHTDDRRPLRAGWGIGRARHIEELDYWAAEMRLAPGPVLVRTVDLPDRAATERRHLERDAAVAYVHAPVRLGERRLGALTWRFGADHPSGGPERVLAAADALASAVALAVHRLEDVHDLWRRLTTDVTGATDAELTVVIAELMEEVAQELGADRIRLVVENDDETTCSAVAGWERPGLAAPPALVVDPTVKVPMTTWRWLTDVARSGRIARVDDTHDAPPEALAERIAWEHNRSRQVLLAPLVHDGRAYGALVLNRVEQGSPWSDGEVARVHNISLDLEPVADRLLRVQRSEELAAATIQPLHSTMQLISSMSHELRTPLHAISGYAELLSIESPAQEPLVTEIRSNAAALATHVDDLLELARPVGTLNTLIEPVVLDVADQLRRSAHARRVAIEIGELPADAVMPLNFAQARQVVRDLVGSSLTLLAPGSKMHVGVDTEPSMRVQLRSTRPIPATSLQFPVSSAVLGRHGRIDVRSTTPPDLASPIRATYEIVARFTTSG